MDLEEKPKEQAAKTAAKKTGAKKAAAKKGAEKKAKAAEKPPKEEIEAVLAEEGKTAAEEEPEPTAGGEEEKLSKEEFRRMVEDSLEKVRVSDIVLTMMNELASIGYLKMGLPENVNMKYRDFDQASLAIDALEGLVKGLEGKLPEESLQPFRGTLANLQLNFVQLKRT